MKMKFKQDNEEEMNKIPYHMMISTLELAPRDKVFRAILNPFSLKYTPLNILQVGAIEDLNLEFKYGSGWSDIMFASYISLFGGHLTIVDIKSNHLKNSKKVLSGFSAGYTLIEIDALTHITDTSNQYDMIYLDGSNDPDETKKQYEKIDKDNTAFIIIDDYSLKGRDVVLDDRYEGKIFNVTDLGIYVGVNHEALKKLTDKIHNPREKVLSDLSIDTFRE